MKLIALLLCEGITANLLAPSACGLQSFPRTHPEPSADWGLRNTALCPRSARPCLPRYKTTSICLFKIPRFLSTLFFSSLVNWEITVSSLVILYFVVIKQLVAFKCITDCSCFTIFSRHFLKLSTPVSTYVQFGEYEDIVRSLKSQQWCQNILFFSGEYINHDLFAFAPLGKVRWYQFGEKRLLSLSSGRVETLSFIPGWHTSCSTMLLTNMLSVGGAANRAGSVAYGAV